MLEQDDSRTAIRRDFLGAGLPFQNDVRHSETYLLFFLFFT